MTDTDNNTYLQSNSANNQTRVGSMYQIDSTQLQHTKHRTDTQCHGTLLYSGKSVKSHNELNNFLHTVQEYFYYAPHLYDEELLLQLLHQSNYNITECQSALEPIDDVQHVDLLDDSSDDDSISIHDGTDNSDDLCAVCGEGGELVICDYRSCIRVFHATCAGLTTLPQGEWYCSAHFCTVCHNKVSSDSPYICTQCPTAYCQYHIPRTVDTSILNTASNHNNTDQNEKHEFLCTRCRVHDDASTVMQERHTFLTQLQSILRQPAHPQLLHIFHEIQQRGGIQELLAGSQWKTVGKLLNTLIHSTNTESSITEPTTHADNGIALTEPATA